MLPVSTGVLLNRSMVLRNLRMSSRLAAQRRQGRRIPRTPLRAMLAVMRTTPPPQQLPTDLPTLEATRPTRLHRLLPHQGRSQRTHTRPTSSPLAGKATHSPRTPRTHPRPSQIHMGDRHRLPRARMPLQGILDTSTNNIWSIAKPQ
jgi:hypothetical protein